MSSLSWDNLKSLVHWDRHYGYWENRRRNYREADYRAIAAVQSATERIAESEPNQDARKGSRVTWEEPAEYTGHVYGWRAFYIGQDGDLQSVAGSYQWTPKVNTCSCNNIDNRVAQMTAHRARNSSPQFIGGIEVPISAKIAEIRDEHGPVPARNCQCGFWTVKSILNTRMWGYTQLKAIGLIAQSGRIVPGSEGYRSQYAEILALFLLQNKLTQINKGYLSRQYQEFADVHTVAGAHILLDPVACGEYVDVDTHPWSKILNNLNEDELVF